MKDDAGDEATTAANVDILPRELGGSRSSHSSHKQVDERRDLHGRREDVG